jgi:DNA mismatch repair ATPase MutS
LAHHAISTEPRKHATQPPSRRIARLGRLADWLEAQHNQFFALFAPLLLWTTQLAFAIEAWRATDGPAIARWLDAVGEFEALCALAAYAYETPLDPFPEIVPEGPLFAAEGLGHPLMGVTQCVPNDVHLGGDLRALVVSGSNMSGKSTLLRTIGVNTVLALTGAPVRARAMKLSPLVIGATLRIQDSLQAGRSRFYAEITRVRQLLDMAKGSPPLLFLLDEFLQGTNSHDRRFGAEAVLRTLIDYGAIGLITTHDLALAEIADRLAPRTANVHFEDHFKDGALAFDYQMRPGVVTTNNALALMRAMGIYV